MPGSKTVLTLFIASLSSSLGLGAQDRSPLRRVDMKVDGIADSESYLVYTYRIVNAPQSRGGAAVFYLDVSAPRRAGLHLESHASASNRRRRSLSPRTSSPPALPARCSNADMTHMALVLPEKEQGLRRTRFLVERRRHPMNHALIFSPGGSHAH